MPKLEFLFFCARASHISDGELDVDMQHLPSLQNVLVTLWDEENCLPAVQKAVDMLTLALDEHPNRPTLFCHQIPLQEEDAEEEEGSATVSP